MKYIDMTPTWQAILPTWLMILRDAIEQEYTSSSAEQDRKGAENIKRATTELIRMAEIADKYNDLFRRAAKGQPSNFTIMAFDDEEFKVIKILLEFHSNADNAEHYDIDAFERIAARVAIEGKDAPDLLSSELGK